jgi:hypothetical protein
MEILLFDKKQFNKIQIICDCAIMIRLDLYGQSFGQIQLQIIDLLNILELINRFIKNINVMHNASLLHHFA